MMDQAVQKQITQQMQKSGNLLLFFSFLALLVDGADIAFYLIV